MRRLLYALLLLLGTTSANASLNVGDRAGPVQLLTLDGHPLLMTNYSERRATVIVFLSARSTPGSARDLETVKELNTRFRQRGILFVGIFPHADETAKEVRRFAQQKGLLFPVYRDPDAQTASHFHADVTPSAFLLDSSGTLLYHGAVGTGDGSPLARAIDALRAGRPIRTTHGDAQGMQIGQPGPSSPRNELNDEFGSVSFSSELLFESITDVPAHHCSTIAEAPNGDLLVVWYGGSFESADDQTLFLSRRNKGDRFWSSPQVLIRNSLQPPGNAVVFHAGNHRLIIVWARMDASRPLRRGGGWGQTRLMYRTSQDNGVTWTEDRPFLDGLLEGVRNVPIVRSDGSLLLPLGHGFAASHDEGKTWERLGEVSGGSQPTVIEREDGCILTLLRRGPYIMESESRDGGRNWTTVRPTGLKNPDAGIAMTRLRGGSLVLVFNNSSSARTPLSVTRSGDEGKTWETPLALESNPGEYSYPCVIQTSDGRIHMTYTFRRYSIKHIELNEGWLTQLSRPN